MTPQVEVNPIDMLVRELPQIASGVFWIKFGWWMGIIAVLCVARLAGD